jgi:hypothetical protein
MAGLVDSLTQGLKAVATHIDDPALLAKALAVTLPAVAFMDLINLEPTGDVIGEYIKNLTVPGLEEYNVGRRTQLEAANELGAKQIPQLAKSMMETQQFGYARQQAVDKAMQMKPQLMESIKQDPYLQNTQEEKLTTLIDDAIKIAPVTFSQNQSLALSIIRAAALSGADTIDPQTAISLLELEQRYTGGF